VNDGQVGELWLHVNVLGHLFGHEVDLVELGQMGVGALWLVEKVGWTAVGDRSVAEHCRTA